MSAVGHLQRMNAKRLLLLLVAVLAATLITTGVAAQTPIDDPIVTVTVQRPATDSDAPLTIGDPIIVTLTITHDASAAIALPTTPQPLGDLDPAAPQLVSRTEDGDRVTWRFDFATRSFFTGVLLVETPPFLFVVDDEQRTITPPPASVTVSSVLPAADVSPRPLKPPLTIDGAGVSTALIVAPIVGIAALLILALAGRRLRASRARRRALAPAPGPTPANTAADALEAIGHATLLPQHIEEYCARINDTVRAFLQTRYAIPATSLTTRELPSRLALAGADAGTVNMVDSLCTEIDAVAYARARPARSRADRYLDLARAIVNPTHPLSDDPLRDAAAPDDAATPDGATATSPISDEPLRPALHEPAPIRQANPEPAPPPTETGARNDPSEPLTDVRWQRPPRRDDGNDTSDGEAP
jgi:hypothetical protein